MLKAVEETVSHLIGASRGLESGRGKGSHLRYQRPLVSAPVHQVHREDIAMLIIGQPSLPGPITEEESIHIQQHNFIVIQKMTI